MKKNQTLIFLIKNSHDELDEKCILEFVDCLKQYYQNLDLDRGGFYFKVFELLFLSDDVHSYENAAEILFTNEKTIGQMVKRIDNFIFKKSKNDYYQIYLKITTL